MISWFKFIFANPSTERMYFIILLNDHLTIFLRIILLIIILNISFLLYEKIFFLFFNEIDDIEIVWTITPFVVLFIILIPSLKFLYMLDSVYTPALSFMVIGHQWYWRYSNSNFYFDSYIKKDNFSLRLVETDNRMIILSDLDYRVLGRSADVIHSWTLPSAGFKIDVIPGRVNNMHLSLNRTGIFYGQCSEICGINHRFIPIFLESILSKDFLKI